MCILVMCMFFFKQKTAYEMRISDVSSDVCSSDLYFDGLTDFPLQLGGADRLLLFHEAVITVFHHLGRHVIGECVRGCAIDRRILETADAIELCFIEPVEQQLEVLFGLARSEEHTSELQSLMRISYAVLCLKKTKKNNQSY